MALLVPVCECGLSYVPGHPEDEYRHAYEHTQYLYGPVVRALRRIPPVRTIGGLSVRIVDGTVAPLDRRKFYRGIALIWARTIPGPSGYDGTVNEDDQRLFLATDGDRIISAVLTAYDNYAWPMRWTAEGGAELVGRKAEVRRRYKVARVWTAAAKRRQGLGLQLLQHASSVLSDSPDNLGWELPFTSSGAYIVRRLCPEHFWGCCDAHTIRDYMNSRNG